MNSGEAEVKTGRMALIEGELLTVMIPELARLIVQYEHRKKQGWDLPDQDVTLDSTGCVAYRNANGHHYCRTVRTLPFSQSVTDFRIVMTDTNPDSYEPARITFQVISPLCSTNILRVWGRFAAFRADLVNGAFIYTGSFGKNTIPGLHDASVKFLLDSSQRLEIISTE